jgi:toxin secretion/phage lysis holin
MREFELKAVLTAVGVYLFGGWSAVLDVLLWAIVLDYVTGLIAAAIEGKLSSKVGFVGIAKKILIVLIVTAAHKLDIALNSQNVIMSTACYFYIANEGLSMLENAARAGVPFPSALKNALLQLRKRDEKPEA